MNTLKSAFVWRFRNFFVVTFFLISFPLSLRSINEVLYSASHNELSSSYFQDILQDSYGYMWIATEYGLNRYDGYNFKKYYKTIGDPKSLNGSFVMSLCEDSRGRIWVGTSVGLNLYDRANDNFVRVKLIKDGTSLSTTAYSIVELHNGDIWITTSQGTLFSLSSDEDVSDGDIVFEPIISDDLGAGNGILYQSSDSTVWFGSVFSGLFHIQDTLCVPVLYNNDIVSGVSSFTEDAFGNVYFASQNEGFFVCEKSTKKLRKISDLLNIRDIYFRAERNDLLLATDGSGVYSYDLGDGKLVHGIPSTTLTHNLNNLKVHKIIEDDNSNLWLGIYHKGVMSIKSDVNKFEYIGCKSYQNNIIGQSAVLSLLKSKNGKLYLGTDGDGFFEVDVERGTSRKIPLMSDKKRERGVAIMNIFEDSEGRLWLSTFKNGLFCVNKSRTQCKYVPLCDRHNLGVVDVVEDGNNNIIVGTYNSGIYELVPHTGEVCHIKEFAPNWINSVKKNEVGDVIFCTSVGVYVLSYHNGRRRIELLPILENEAILSYEYGWNHDLWINTHNGVYLYNEEKDPSLVRINDKYPVLDCKTQSIILDDNGSLWISSNQGLFCLHASLNELDEYNDIDGIQSNEFCGTGIKDESGRMYFGGIGGVTHFLPNDIKKESTKLDVYLSEFETENGPLVGLDSLTDFELDYDEETFSLSFSTLNLVESRRVNFLYRIRNLSPEWQQVKKGDNVLKFTNLPLGEHTLEVYAKLGRDVVSPINSYTIRIKPPWYLTVFAKLMYFVFAIMLMAVLYVYYLRERKRKQNLFILENKQYVNAEKLKYFVNISHEIKTPLSMIVAPLEQLLKGKRESKETYQMMYKNAVKISNLIGEVSDIQQIDSGLMKLNLVKTDIVPVINEIISDIQYNADLKNLKLDFRHEFPAVMAMIDGLAFEKIIVNLLSNAIKYTPVDGNIVIYLKYIAEEKQIKIIVQDDGPGIDEEILPNVFKRFYKGTKGNVTGSTGIGLNLTLSLVEMHNGEIKAENRQEVSGARFVVTLPADLEVPVPTPIPAPVIVSAPQELSQLETDSDLDLQESDKIERLKSTILIVDDEIEIRRYLASLFNKRYEVVEAADGLEALEIAIKLKPDLILSDIMMPNMNGIALVNKIRRNAQLSLTPIVLLTAKTSTEDKLESLRLGVDAFISKPFNVDILLTTIHNLLSRQENLEKQSKVQYHYENDIEKISAVGNEDKFVKQLNEILSANLSNPEFNVNTLCDDMLISRMQLHRKMKMLFNTTASDYLRNMRLKAAANLLAESDFNISEIAYMVGFNNASHFSATFKTCYGYTPKEYAANNNNSKE